MRNLQNDIKTNDFESMLKRLSSLNPKQLDTFLQDYHSIDDATSVQAQKELDDQDLKKDKDSDPDEHEHEHEHDQDYDSD